MDEYNSQKSMQHKKEEYVQSFTIHGLSKIFTGTRIESIFWTCVVLFGICISNFVIYGLISKYYRYEIYTEVSVKVTNRNTFPSITFCDNKLMTKGYFAYCGVPHGSKHASYKAACEKYPKNYSKITNVIKDGPGWSNGLFNVTKCYTWGSKMCANEKYMKSLSKHNNTCFTFNWNGDLHDPYSHAYMEFELNKASTGDGSFIVGLVHDPRILELEMTNRVIIEPSKTYELKISKTVLKRLPHPFPSNCTEGKRGDIFPGKYTRRTCIETVNYINMLKHCGDVLDYHKRLIPEDLLKKYQRNQSISQALRCMLSYSATEVKGLTDMCPVPCEEVELYTMSTFNEMQRGKDVNKTVYRIHVQYQNVDAYKVFLEKQLHSWDQIAGEVGGFLGLVIGASFISIIEIVAYFILCLLHKLFHGEKKEKEVFERLKMTEPNSV